MDRARKTAYAKAWRKKNRAKVAASKKKSALKSKLAGIKRVRIYDERAKKRQERYRLKNPDAVRAARKHWKQGFRDRNRLQYMVETSRSTASGRGLKSTLTKEWFAEHLAGGVCEMTGLPFDMVGKRTPLSPSVDRIDPFGPYAPENCRIIIWWLNRALSNLGEDFAIDVFRRVIERRNG